MIECNFTALALQYSFSERLFFFLWLVMVQIESMELTSISFYTGHILSLDRKAQGSSKQVHILGKGMPV